MQFTVEAIKESDHLWLELFSEGKYGQWKPDEYNRQKEMNKINRCFPAFQMKHWIWIVTVSLRDTWCKGSFSVVQRGVMVLVCVVTTDVNLAHPPPWNEYHLCSLAEQACPLASTKHSNIPERHSVCQVLPFYQFARVWQRERAGLGEENEIKIRDDSQMNMSMKTWWQRFDVRILSINRNMSQIQNTQLKHL